MLYVQCTYICYNYVEGERIMPTTNLTIRIDAELKKESEKLFKELGMNMTTAITTFLKQSIRQQGIPYPISKNIPNEETLAALKEAYEHPESLVTYNSFEEFEKDLQRIEEKYK